jgi:hypothetical protein
MKSKRSSVSRFLIGDFFSCTLLPLGRGARADFCGPPLIRIYPYDGRRDIPLKLCSFLQKLGGVTTQHIVPFRVTDMRISNPTTFSV